MVNDSATVLVRPAVQADIPAMIDISQSVNPWKVEHQLPGAELVKIGEPVDVVAKTAMYEKWISQNEWSPKALRVFVAEADGDVLGFMLLALGTPRYFAAMDLKQMYLASVTVHRKHGGRGIGDAMMVRMKEEAARMELDIIRAECARGRLEAWYVKHGFVSVPYLGDVANYPSDVHTMLEMPCAAFRH